MSGILDECSRILVAPGTLSSALRLATGLAACAAPGIHHAPPGGYKGHSQLAPSSRNLQTRTEGMKRGIEENEVSKSESLRRMDTSHACRGI
eukprot:5697653-Amphidinium_carterae.1